MDVKMLVQSTPNPNALKFVINTPVKTQGNVTYKNAEQCQHNPLAAALFTIANVTEVYFFDNYITVSQDGTADWDEIEDQVRQIIMDQIETHDPNFIVEEAQKPKPVASNDPDVQAIEAILDRTIRPALQMDGGDLNVTGYDGATLSITYQGACGTCPSATMGTLKAIENILRDEFNPEIVVELADW